MLVGTADGCKLFVNGKLVERPVGEILLTRKLDHLDDHRSVLLPQLSAEVLLGVEEGLAATREVLEDLE